MRDLPEHLWHETYKRRAFRRVMDGTPSERRGGPPSGLRRLEANAPCKAITSGAISEFVHPAEDRYLTLRECARIQTFPDSFTFDGTVAQMSLQIGNAVPPLLARVIAESLRQDISAMRPPQFSGGALLSFVPTLSTGMSPALTQVCSRVRREFDSNKTKEPKQLLLWP
jgi:DNA (cytosine-5)-methyltransferase 1